jgi:hypothetical protein
MYYLLLRLHYFEDAAGQIRHGHQRLFAALIRGALRQGGELGVTLVMGSCVFGGWGRQFHHLF